MTKRSRFDAPPTILPEHLRTKGIWFKKDFNVIPLNRPLLVKTYKGEYCVMYYHPKFRDGSQIGTSAKRAWVSVSMDDLLYGPKGFTWIPWNGVVSYYEFPLDK